MNINSPVEIVKIAGQLAGKKESYPVGKLLILSFLAGVYIAFGGLLAITVAGGMPGITAENPGLQKLMFGSLFPLGIILVVLAGAELFTGNTAYFISNVLNGKQKWTAPLRNWFWVYLGNFAGALFAAYFLTFLPGLISQGSWGDMVAAIAEKKTHAPFHVTFLKALGANWLVCLGLWLGMSARDTTGKILGMWWPVMAFVAMGLEHCVANMYFIPLAMMQGAPISIGTFLVKNLIPATLGNIVGGGFFVGALYWAAWGRENRDEKTVGFGVSRSAS